MRLIRAFKKRFTVQFIAIGLEERRCNVYVQKIKNDMIIHVEKKSFEIESKDRLSAEAINFLNTLQEEHEQTYIALFLNTFGQGAVFGCGEFVFQKFGIDQKSVKSLCVEENFTIYASLIDIQWMDKVFSRVGLDFIFSPFLVLNYCTKQETAQEDTVLYMLNTNNGLTLMIKQEKKLLYGAFFNVAKEENLLFEDYENSTGNSLNLEDTMFDDFDMDESSMQEMQELGGGASFDEEVLAGKGLSDKDTRLIKYLDASLKEFYNSDLYESAFITKVNIYDDVGINNDVLKYIQNDLFIETTLKSIDLLGVIVDIAKEEVLANA